MNPIFKSSRSKIIVGIIFFLLLISFPAYFFYDKFQNPKDKSKMTETIPVKGEVKFVAGEATTSSQPTPTSQASPSPKAKVVEFKLAIYNGTKIGGLAAKTGAEIKKTFPGVILAEKGNAINDYDKTIVVILNNLQKDIALKIASDLKAKTDSLPAGEKKPEDVDILILLGKDRR